MTEPSTRAIPAAALAIVIIVAVRGFVLMVLWRWFVNPELSAQNLGWLHACGVVLVVRVLVSSATKAEPTDEPFHPIRGAIAASVTLAVSLPIGALIGALS